MLSQTVEYALRAMMHLAALNGESATSDRIAQETKVPGGYLSKVMRDLVVAGLVESFRGPGGGFSLARTPDLITILDVVNAVDPIKRIHKCPIDDPNHPNLCALHRRIDGAMSDIQQALERTTLAALLSDDAATRAQSNQPLA
jgi:Rrf2 family protein